MLTGYTGLPVSVTGMGVLINVRDDPDVSLGLTAGFGLFALVFVVVLARLYRLLVVPARKGTKDPCKCVAWPCWRRRRRRES